MEGESFSVYRDSLTFALQSITESDVGKVQQAFDDLVRPELNNIELAIKNSRKLLWGSLAHDIAFSAGFVAVGLFSGLLPANIGEIVATLGGFKFVSGSLEKASKLIQEPPEVRNSKYYFLWKVQKKAGR